MALESDYHDIAVSYQHSLPSYPAGPEKARPLRQQHWMKMQGSCHVLYNRHCRYFWTSPVAVTAKRVALLMLCGNPLGKAGRWHSHLSGASAHLLALVGKHHCPRSHSQSNPNNRRTKPLSVAGVSAVVVRRQTLSLMRACGGCTAWVLSASWPC